VKGHHTSVTVRFADLDPWGHVNHARYLSYFESARIELLEEIGFGIMDMAAAGHLIVLVEMTARYHAASNLHDVLSITTRVGEVSRATSHWHQEARSGDTMVATLDIRAAFTDADGRPTRPPEGFAGAVSVYAG
jgi:acyl-CoA thioester hydrolase